MAELTMPSPGSTPGAAPRRRSRLKDWPAVALIGLALVYILLPIAAVLLYSLATRWTTHALPDGYTLAHWGNAFTDERFRAVLLRSLGLALLVAAADVILVAPAVYWQRVRNPSIRPVLETLAAIPFAMPLLVIAFGLLRATGDLLPSVQGTVGLLFAGHTAIAFSFVYWAIDGSMAAAKVETLTEAGRTCGAGPAKIIRHVILPNIGPGIAAGAIMAFGISFNEIALVQLLVGSRFETAQLYMLNLLKSADADFNILAVMTAVNFIITLLVSIAVVYVNGGSTTLGGDIGRKG